MLTLHAFFASIQYLYYNVLFFLIMYLMSVNIHPCRCWENLLNPFQVCFLYTCCPVNVASVLYFCKLWFALFSIHKIRAVQTPVFSPPAQAKKTPAPAKKLRLRQKILSLCANLSKLEIFTV